MSYDCKIGIGHCFLLLIQTSGDFPLPSKLGWHMDELGAVAGAGAALPPPLASPVCKGGLWAQEGRAAACRVTDSSLCFLLDYKSKTQMGQQDQAVRDGLELIHGRFPIQLHSCSPCTGACTPECLAHSSQAALHPSPFLRISLVWGLSLALEAEERGGKNAAHPPVSVVPGGPCNPLPSHRTGLQHLPPLGCEMIRLVPWQTPAAVPQEADFSAVLLLGRDGWFYIHGSSHCSEKSTDREVIHPALPAAPFK